MLDKENSNLFLVFALVPITGVLGLQSLFLNNMIPKIFHIVLDIILVVLITLAVIEFSIPCPKSSVCAAAGVMIVPTIAFALFSYLYSIIESVILFVRAKK